MTLTVLNTQNMKYYKIPLIIPSEWVIKFNNISWTADSEVHVVHISCVIIAYKLH